SFAFTITPEPSDCCTSSREGGSAGSPKNWRMIGSLKNGFTATRRWLVEEMFTTAGDTLASIGASDGSAWPLTATGSVPAATGSAQASASARAAIRNDGQRVRVADDMAAPSVVEPAHYRTSSGCDALGFSAPRYTPRLNLKIFRVRPFTGPVGQRRVDSRS